MFHRGVSGFRRAAVSRKAHLHLSPIFSPSICATSACFQRRTPELSFPVTRLQSSGQTDGSAFTISYQKNAATFLERVRNKRLQQGLVCQKVEDTLLQFLKYDNVPIDGPLALDLLNAALINANIPHERLIPRVFSLACQVMVRSGHPLALKEVHRQLLKLLDGHKTYLTDDLPFNTHNVNDACCQLINHVVLESNRKKQRLDHATRKQVDSLIKRMQEFYADPSVPLVASADSCNAFVMYYGNQQNPKEAYKVLKWMVNESGSHPVELIPRVSSFTSTISSFAKSGDPETSMEIIQWMLSSYKSKSSAMPPPNESCFNGLIHAWAKSGRKDAGEKAEQTLEWMQQLQETEGLDTKPDSVSYSVCINAWARSPTPEAPIKAESILRRMITMYESGSQIVPGEAAFTSVMNAWANSKRENAPVKAAALLGMMRTMSKTTSGLEITAIPYTVLIKAWERTARHTKGRGRLRCGDEALKVLLEMENVEITPTATTYNAVITAMLETSTTNAVLYFLELEQKYRNGSIRLNTRTFNCGLNAIATMNKPDAAEKSMDVLQRMFEYSLSENAVQPDETTINVILKVLSRSASPDAASKAQSLLLEMESMPNVKPSMVSYLTCVIAWGRSNDMDKFKQVQDLLFHFQNAHRKGRLAGKVTVAVYNSALSVCYHNKSPGLHQEALDTADTTMMELRKLKRLQPDHITYLSLFRTIGSQAVGDKREELLEKEIANCINDGLVSRDILEVVHESSQTVFHQVFGDNVSPRTASIPANWSKRATTRRQ